MPITRDERGFLIHPDAWGGPAVGLETVNLQACIEEVQSRKWSGVFGRHPEFKDADLSCLEATPHLTSVQLWDINLSNVSTIYGLPQLAYFRISGKRPPIDFAKLPTVKHLVVEHNSKDVGFSMLPATKMMNLWRFRAPAKSAFEFDLPDTLEKLGIYWSNVESLSGFGVCPNVRRLEIARCRNLLSLGNLRSCFPKLEHLVVDACGRLTAEEAMRALDGHPNISHAFAGKKLIVSSNGVPDP